MRRMDTLKRQAGFEEGRSLTIWKKQKDGLWKLVMDMGLPKD